MAQTTQKNIEVFGVYPSGSDAERGAADLISAGFPSPDISVLLADMRSKRERASAARGDAHSGGLLNGALGILCGESAPVIPGIGPIVAAGPITARLESEAKSFEGRIQDGGTLLAVRCESAARAKRAKQVLNSSGADDVAELA